MIRTSFPSIDNDKTSKNDLSMSDIAASFSHNTAILIYKEVIFTLFSINIK